MAVYKNPNQMVDKWEQNYGDKIKTPLDEFKNFENALYIGAVADDDKRHYGIHPFGDIKAPLHYKDLPEIYSKSKGQFASQFNNPDIKKYHDEQVAKRNAIYDRIRKVPQDEWGDFAYQYGYFSDPFDFEGEPENVISMDEFINGFDNGGYLDIQTLEDYLNKRGY